MLLVLSIPLRAQIHEPTYVDIGDSRNSGSAPIGLNLSKTYDTNIQLTHDTWSGSHAILFNSYRNATNITGNLETPGEIRYANDPGAYDGGAAAIMYFGNGGIMDFLISPVSTGADSSVTWGTPKMRIKRNGYIGINTTDPTTRLTVNGGVKANEVTVTDATGADFVFNNNYSLPDLNEVEASIIKNKHLPGIPSAKEMRKNGVKVGNLQMKLLRKIEELTLYAINQNNQGKEKKEQIIRLRKENRMLKIQLKKLLNRVKKLEKSN
jgi:hypothetical protein